MKKNVVCMLAYANYFTDARIKNYVDALLKAGYKVDVFALGKSEQTQPGLRLFCLMSKVWSQYPWVYILAQIWFLLIATFRVGMACLKRRYTLVHVHNIPDFIVFSAFVPKLLGAKIILDIHDTMPESYATKFDLSLNHPLIVLLKWEERLSARFAHKVITTNQLHKMTLCSHGIDERKIEIILNVGNDRFFRPQKKQKLHDGLTLVYHGTIAERLGIDLIIRALANVREKCPGVRLLLIGEGDLLDAIRSLVEELELENRVCFKGFVPVEDLSTHLCDADVGIIGNRSYTEAKKNFMLPVKMLEYAAMEIPTIAPRLKVIQHYFNENSAFYYEPDNVNALSHCIIQIYKDRKILVNKKNGLRKFNQKYNWPSMEKNYLGILDELKKDGLHALCS